MPENFATAWDVKSSQNIAVERSANGCGNVVVMVMDYDNPATVQMVELSASAAARIAAVMAPGREDGSLRPAVDPDHHEERYSPAVDPDHHEERYSPDVIPDHEEHGCSYCGHEDAVGVGVDAEGDWICEDCALPTTTNHEIRR